MKNSLLIVLLLTSLSPLIGQSSNYLDIYFSENTSEIEEQSLEALEQLTNDIFSSHIIENLVLESFPKSDKLLIGDRTEILREELLFNGHKVNRLIHYKKLEHLYFDHAAVKNWNFIRIRYDFYSVNKKQSFAFSKENRYEKATIETNKETTLYLKKGCIVDIPPNAFVDSNGELVTENVIVETLEVLDFQDAILNNVTTNIGEHFLESRGMISIEAYSMAGEKLSLAKDKSLSIQIPKNSKVENATENFSIYKGLLVEGSYDWILDTVSLGTSSRTIRKLYHWEKATDDERASIASQRMEIIKKWEDKGTKKRAIRKRINRYKHNYKKRHRKYKERKYKSTKSDRDYEKLSKTMILAKAKYKWHRDTSSLQAWTNYYKFASFSLGMWNIDRMYKTNRKTQELAVQNNDQREIKLMFKESFVLISGIKKNNTTVFPNIPIDEEIILISTKRNSEEEIEFGYADTTTGAASYTINEHQKYTQIAYKKALDNLLQKE